MPDDVMGVVCGVCGSGPVYFETCDIERHDWATASECQNCGERWEIDACKDCRGGPEDDDA